MRVPKEHSHGVFSQPPINYTPTEIAALSNDVRICKLHLIGAPNWKLHPVATDPLTKAIIDGALTAASWVSAPQIPRTKA
jgi:hypothetical protein